jgi:hypothetical protein
MLPLLQEEQVLEPTWRLSALESVPLSPLPSEGLCLDLQEDQEQEDREEEEDQEEDPQQDPLEDRTFPQDI